MADERTNVLYDQVVLISKTYLGPAAERFVYRQVKNHLSKEPHELTATDMPVLVDWIRISVSVLTEDSGVINEYAHQLEELVNEQGGRHGD